MEKPFLDAKTLSCDLVIIPSGGTFRDLCLNNCSVGLHIGICDQAGQIMEFDKNGLKYPSNNPSWAHCLNLKFMEQLTPDLISNEIECDIIRQVWAQALRLIEIKQSTVYEKDTSNCLDFIVAFIKQFCHLLKEVDVMNKHKMIAKLESIDNKVLFCETFVVPRTSLAAKYLIFTEQTNKTF